MLGANLISIGTIVTTCAYIHALALRADWEWRNTGRNLWQKVHRLVTTWNHGDVDCRRGKCRHGETLLWLSKTETRTGKRVERCVLPWVGCPCGPGRTSCSCCFCWFCSCASQESGPGGAGAGVATGWIYLEVTLESPSEPVAKHISE